VTIAQIRPFASDPAERGRIAGEFLMTLIGLFDQGMREPLPLYCLTSAAYAEAARSGGDPVTAAGKAWTSDWKFSQEDSDLEHQLVLGGIRTLEDLLAEPSRSDQQGDGWDLTEPSRFGRYARRMWDGLLSCEELTKR
jgi:exodeoxyribonuclease V gamma subunit